MRYRIYRLINAAVILLSLPFLYRGLRSMLQYVFEMQVTYIFLIAGMLFTLTVLILKAARFYLIVLEKNMGVLEFVKLYAKTTLISLLLPFKLGEFYRIYCCSMAFDGIRTGGLMVLLDRYFDTIPLLALLAGAVVLGNVRATGLVWFLSVFVILATVVYMIVPSTCRYLNHFLIINSVSRKGIMALECLKRMWFLRKYVAELVEDREEVLMFLSSCAWLAEYAALWCLVRGMGEKLYLKDFLNYMNSVLVGGTYSYRGVYVGTSVLLLAWIALTSYIGSIPGRRRKSE